MNARAVLATAPEIRANPLREESVTLKAADPCTFVVFGASGDLTHRKLIPALFRLSKQKLLHPQSGQGLRQTCHSFRVSTAAASPQKTTKDLILVSA